ncbi:hypothetical protein BJ875DRAFT_446694 [Amylocarpus encephaloides]|uniref:Uncharacterized protein n=1 Tax=Amylocarpus encephaloides TaxID=45428 RepID=A0A9P8C074_9HELO|nr:hypothetical protein BJ875DRAFT_446694 [Amylocarpus encephaloides]
MSNKTFRVTAGPPTEAEPFGATSYPLGPLEGRVPGPYQFALTRATRGVGARAPPAIPRGVMASSTTGPLAVKRTQYQPVPPDKWGLDQPTRDAFKLGKDESQKTQVGELLRLPPRRLISIRPDGNCKDPSSEWRRSSREATVAFIVGTVRAESEACVQCQAGRGPFTSCVVVDGTREKGGPFLVGGCANCRAVDSSREMCSLRRV